MKKIVFVLILVQSGFTLANPDPRQLLIECSVNKENKKEITSFELYGKSISGPAGDSSGEMIISQAISILGINHHTKNKLLYVGGSTGTAQGFSSGIITIDVDINGEKVTLNAKGYEGKLIFKDETIELVNCNNKLDLTKP